jgi:hypothetical protein
MRKILYHATVSLKIYGKYTDFSFYFCFTRPRKSPQISQKDKGGRSHGADPLPLPLRVAKTGRNHLNEEFTPLFRTCSATAPM